MRARHKRRRNFLLVPRHIVAGQLGKTRNPRLTVVAGIPDQTDDAARPQQAGDLRERDSLVEPVERLGGDDCVGRLVAERDLLRGARDSLDTRHVRAQLVEHLLERLDSYHVVTERREQARQLAGARSEVDDPQRRLTGDPQRRFLGITGPRALVGVGDRTEGPRPNRRIVAQTRPRNERIAST